jgi:hypothetical protein
VKKKPDKPIAYQTFSVCHDEVDQFLNGRNLVDQASPTIPQLQAPAFISPFRHAEDGRRKMTSSIGIRLRFNAGLRSSANTATNKWDASSS